MRGRLDPDARQVEPAAHLLSTEAARSAQSSGWAESARAEPPEWSELVARLRARLEPQR